MARKEDGVIDLEAVTRIRHLHHAEHWPVGTIARELGVHHETVERVLAEEQRFTSDIYLISLARDRLQLPTRLFRDLLILLIFFFFFSMSYIALANIIPTNIPSRNIAVVCSIF